MVFIYLIEDINDLKYVGSTTQPINCRHANHRCDKYRNHGCSSAELHLEYSIIYLLEECSEEDRKERESYWINKIDCVNKNKLDFDEKEYRKEYNKNNDYTDYKREWYLKNRERILNKPRKPLTRKQRDRANYLRREQRKLKREQLENNNL